MKETIIFIEPIELYNLLNQINLGKPCITNKCYLLLFDVRKQEEYLESHIVQARHVPFVEEKGYIFPQHVDYSAIENIVVMDRRATSVKEVSSPSVICAQLVWGMGSKYPVQVVKGGFEDFSALYPFLRSQKFLYTQREIESTIIYPIEVIPGFLYMGVSKQASDKAIAKDLKIKAHVNVTENDDPRFTVNDMINGRNKEIVPQLLNMPVKDNIEVDWLSQFTVICTFIDQHRMNDKRGVLVHSELGISRCVTIILAYMINNEKIPLKEAVKKTSRCHKFICPNRKFIEDLLEWEEIVLGQKVTQREELGFLSYK